MPTEFDPADYVHAPIITVSTGVTLALALVDSCPPGASPVIVKARDRLSKTAVDARDALAGRNHALGVYSDEDSRVLDNEADRAWGALRMRIQAMAMLSPARFPKATRAAEIDALLFTAGMEFLKAEYAEQSTRMSAILAQIDTDKLAPDLDAIAGVEFLQAVRDVQPRYEVMVRERLRRDKAMGQNLLDIVRGLQAAIVNYAAKIIATIEDDDPATVEAARVALVPIANHRAAAKARAAADAPAATPAAPATPAGPTTGAPTTPATITPDAPATPADPSKQGKPS
jgi:hypothetical protein